MPITDAYQDTLPNVITNEESPQPWPYGYNHTHIYYTLHVHTLANYWSFILLSVYTPMLSSSFTGTCTGPNSVNGSTSSRNPLQKASYWLASSSSSSSTDFIRNNARILIALDRLQSSTLWKTFLKRHIAQESSLSSTKTSPHHSMATAWQCRGTKLILIHPCIKIPESWTICVTDKFNDFNSFFYLSPICFIQRHRFETCLYGLIHGSLKGFL